MLVGHCAIASPIVEVRLEEVLLSRLKVTVCGFTFSSHPYFRSKQVARSARRDCYIMGLVW